jgi:hypothetical protein
VALIDQARRAAARQGTGPRLFLLRGGL